MNLYILSSNLFILYSAFFRGIVYNIYSDGGSARPEIAKKTS